MQIWADASYNAGKAGLGVLIRKLTPMGWTEMRISQSIPCKDNNIAELKAIILGLEQMGADDTGRIAIITDSVSAIDAIKKSKNASYGGKRGELGRLIRQKLEGKKWKVYHCKAHVDKISENVYTTRQSEADGLAKGALDNFLQMFHPHRR
jgi:ribonuclease HI